MRILACVYSYCALGGILNFLSIRRGVLFSTVWEVIRARNVADTKYTVTSYALWVF